MCNLNFLRLVAGEPVFVTDVVYFDRGTGRTYTLNVSVEKDYRFITYIEASMPGVKAVRIPHCYLFSKERPVRLEPKQQNIWMVLRFCFRKEIAFYEAQCLSKEKALRQELCRASRTESLSPKREMVVLPVVSAISTQLYPSSAQMNPVSLVATKLPSGTPDWNEKQLASEPSPKPRGMVLNADHLLVVNQVVGIFKLPTPEGPVWFIRSLSPGRGAYQLRLEVVPVRHSLHQLFTQEKQLGRTISVDINRQGPMLTSVGSPAWKLVAYLEKALYEEPGRQRIAA